MISKINSVYVRRSKRIAEASLHNSEKTVKLNNIAEVKVTPTLFSEWASNDSGFASAANHILRMGGKLNIELSEPTTVEKYYMDLGVKHEKNIINKLAESAKSVCILNESLCTIENFNRTISLMQSGIEIISGAYLIKELTPTIKIHGFADILVKVDGVDSSLGNYCYKVIEVKSSYADRNPKYRLQAACYAWMLNDIQGCWPPSIEIQLAEELISIEKPEYKNLFLNSLNSYVEFLNLIKTKLINSKGAIMDLTPYINLPGSNHKLWSSSRKQLLKEIDSIRSIWGITGPTASKLEVAGIETIDQLLCYNVYKDCQGHVLIPGDKINDIIANIKCKECPDGSNKHKKIGDNSLRTILQQAHAQKQSFIKNELMVYLKDVNKLRAVMPCQNEYDLVWDIEGMPLKSLNNSFVQAELKGFFHYLHGVASVEDISQENLFWANSLDEEVEIFDRFVHHVESLISKSNNQMHIYVFNEAYEKNAIKNLAEKYKIHQDTVDKWINSYGLIVDLYKIFKDNFVFGADSYGLKSIERLFGNIRENAELSNGQDSILMRIEYERNQNQVEKDRIKKIIEDYNRDDLISTRNLLEYIRSYE